MSPKYRLTFQCRKCQHKLILETTLISRVKEITKRDCPECGEEPYENWILLDVSRMTERSLRL